MRIEIETKRTFDMHKIFPSKYARSPLEDHPPDIEPETELYPEKLHHLAATIHGSTVTGKSFTLRFTRGSREGEEMVAESGTAEDGA